MNTLESLKWRYAVKKYDAGKKISENDLETLKEAVQLSVSSMGLQPYKVLVIEDEETRKKLAPVAYNQNGITDASHVFIFANIVNVGEKEIEEYLNNIAETRGVSRNDLKGFEDMLYGAINGMDEQAKQSWTAKQTYIALSTLINTAAEMQIDATPMEGFDAEGVNQVLGLDKLGLNAAVMATVGYRHKEDDFQHLKKVRKPKEKLFINI
ncbi:NAD(P)H-dependent oxidoreductase [Flavobacterium sp. MK4S-17]|uniref:NAD(P)H-dependent oxidoreductase n=1 Tax=Flavobacterium sp. MK4S-17 TaxID=2543737 RepID=UPI0013568A6C|nr:NAD(P)H-dependent oxidoreductase [Flavobacterium sp. MK4S-17]